MIKRYFDEENEQVFGILFHDLYFCVEHGNKYNLDQSPFAILLTWEDLINPYIGPQERKELVCQECGAFLPGLVEEEWYEPKTTGDK